MFEANEIVPEVIDRAPESSLTVEWSKRITAQMGNILTPKQVKKQPTVTWKAEEKAFYTLCMTDPDAPSRAKPKFREWQHWLVVNIPQNAVSSGQVLTEYVGPTPPKDSGLHRYVFLLYKQPSKMTFQERKLTKQAKNRGNFSIKKFANSYKLGDPIAGNFFQAEWDEYVAKLQKELNG